MDAKKKKKKKQHDNAPAVASVLKTRVIKKEFKKTKKTNQTHPSPSKWIFVSLHRGSTMPIEQLLLEK